MTQPQPTVVAGTPLNPTPPASPHFPLPPAPAPAPAPAPVSTSNWLDRIISRQAKAWAGLLIPVYAWAGFVIDSPSQQVTAHEWYLLGGAVLTGLGVYGAANSVTTKP